MMKKLNVITLLVISILFVSQIAQAATYYVATTGNDDYTTAQAQNPATPWRTIQRCLSSVTAGSTCTVANGTYAGGMKTVNSGSSGSPITLKSTNQFGAKITTPTVTNVMNESLGIYHSYYIVEGFEFIGAGGQGSSKSPGVSNLAIGVHYNSNTIIRRNKIHGMSRTICTPSAYGSNGIFVEKPSNLLIEGNIIYSIGRLLLGESGCGIDDHTHDHGIYILGGSNLTVQNNLIYDAFRGWPIHLDGGTVNNVRIYNNTLADNASIYNPGQIILGSTINGADIRNNVCYNPLYWCVHYTQTPPSFSNVLVSNNLTTSAMDGGNRPSGISFIENFTKQMASELFKNPDIRDYTPKVGSTAIDSGLSIPEVALDLVGTRRPQLNGHDIGAMEFSGTATNTGSPAAPTGLRVY